MTTPPLPKDYMLANAFAFALLGKVVSSTRYKKGVNITLKMPNEDDPVSKPCFYKGDEVFSPSLIDANARDFYTVE